MCRCFVGTAQQMYDVLIGKLSKLPPGVKVHADELGLSLSDPLLHLCICAVLGGMCQSCGNSLYPRVNPHNAIKVSTIPSCSHCRIFL